MNTKLLIAAATLALVSVPALAADAPTPPDGCQFVSIYEPNVTPDAPEIHVIFRGNGADVASVKYCNPDPLVGSGASAAIAVYASPSGNAMVTIKTPGDGRGTIALPSNYASGDLYQAVCDVKDGDIVVNFYAYEWADGLPQRLEMVDRTTEIAPQLDYYKTSCRASMPASMRSRLTATAN